MDTREQTSSMGTLVGWAEVEVFRFEGEPTDTGGPKRETVRVLQLPVKEYHKLMSAQGDELALVQIYTGKPKEWVEQLAPASHEAIIEKGEGLNGDFFKRWLGRLTSRVERVQPGLAAKVFGAAFNAPTGSVLPDTSPSSPASAVTPGPKR